MTIPKHDYDALTALYAAEPLVQQAFDLHYAYGFTLQMVSAPDVVQFSEWLPMLFKSRELPEFKSKRQMEAVAGALLSIWSFWAEETADSETLSLPPGCGLDEAGNPSPALKEFCRGYIEGSEWLRELWDEALEGYDPESAEEKIIGTPLFLCLRFLEGPDLPENSPAAVELKAVSISDALKQLPDALNDAAALGRALHMESLRRSGPVKAAPKPGRNDPCPCGSGKKYKKCCM